MYLNFFSDEGASVQGTGIFVILYFVLLFLLSCLLLQGVKTDIRGFMMPWVYAMYIGKKHALQKKLGSLKILAVFFLFFSHIV